MKAIAVLGTSSNAGKSWVATALCAWLRQRGVSVAPFKAQNMANNAYATLEGGEIGVAQATQAEACGLRPIAEMNPILLKPCGPSRSQIVRLGKAGEEVEASRYYETVEDSWKIVARTLDWWKERVDTLVLEGAGSPVELNIMSRDIVNLRPIEHVDGSWILVADIEEGGVFAQVVGTWQLLPEDMRRRGLGFVVNKFRGDVRLFADAAEHFGKHLPLPYLGTLPFLEDIRIDDEDSLNAVSGRGCDGAEPVVAWVKYPQVSNTQDQLPWREDSGWRSVWTRDARTLGSAAAIALPGSKNTIGDLRWLREQGLDTALLEATKRGIPIIGICGGYQMLGHEIEDGGDREAGLGLLPIVTRLRNEKLVARRVVELDGERWETFEIHTGRSDVVGTDAPPALVSVETSDGQRLEDGMALGKVWGTYQHGIFDGAAMRRRFSRLCGLADRVEISTRDWRVSREDNYKTMAAALERHLDLGPIRRYLGIE